MSKLQGLFQEIINLKGQDSGCMSVLGEGEVGSQVSGCRPVQI